MDMYYRHKTSKQIISQEELKEKKNMTFNFVYFTKTNEEERYIYKGYEIPFSDDWEVIFDEQELSIGEIHELINSLKYSNYGNYKLQEKLINMLDNKNKVVHSKRVNY